MPSMDLLFRFLGVDAGAGHEFDRLSGKAATTGSVMEKVAFGAAAAAGTVAVASVKMAADFQTSMTRLSTQANVSNKNVAILGKGILNMSAAVATTPNVLAQAAYHIASVGQHSFTAAQELRILRVATEGAKIGGADLVDVTNTLDALLISHLRGVKNYSQAMGVLNSTVGAGDMQMQDLAEALGPLGSTFKGFGVSVQQAGAALAVFGDNGIRGQLAGSQLRQSITALADPLKAGRDQLVAWGIKTGDLSKQLAHGGLTSALDLLTQKLHENGYTAKTMGPILAEMFGKRGPQQGLSTLINQLDRYKGKLQEVDSGGKTFASSWKGYTKTFGYAWDSAKSSAETMLIELGTKLLPVATKFTTWIAQTAIPDLTRFAHWLAENSRWTKPLAIGLGAAGAALMVFMGPISATVIGLTAIGAGLVEAYRHSETFRTVVQGAMRATIAVFEAVKTAAVTVWHGIDAVWQAFADGPLTYVQARVRDFSNFWHSHLTEIRQVAHVVWSAIHTVIKVQWGAAMAFIRPALTVLKAAFRTAFDAVKNIVSTAVHVIGDVLSTAQHIIQDFVGFVLDVITGHWGKAWGDAKSLVSDAIHGVGRILGDFAAGALNLLYQAGRDIVTGLINGMKSMISSAIGVVKSIGSSIKGAFTGLLHIGSPSKVFHGYGVNVVEGLVNGVKSKVVDAKRVARLLAEGLIGGWRGEAASIKDALTTPVQNALEGVTGFLSKLDSRMKAAVSKAHSHYKSLLSAQNSAISGLQSNLTSGADLSNVFGTDANGRQTVGNVGQYLGTQASAVKQFLGDVESARRLKLSPLLLGQIENMGYAQGDVLLKQLIASGAAGIHQADQSAALIQSGARQAASVVVKTPGEQATLKASEGAYKSALRQEHQLERHTHLLERIAAEIVSHGTRVTVNGKSYDSSDPDAQKIIQAIKRLERKTGKRYLAP